MATTVALLRGINVGGKRRLPMKELRDALGAAGFGNVRTYLQSGNVIFDDTPDDDDPASSIARVVADVFDLDVEVVCRTQQELELILLQNPFLGQESDLAKLHVVFLDAAPDAERVAELDPDRSPLDRFVIKDRDVFVHYPDGAARSKLAVDYFERVLGRVATARNWNTVTRLVPMLAS